MIDRRRIDGKRIDGRRVDGRRVGGRRIDGRRVEGLSKWARLIIGDRWMARDDKIEDGDHGWGLRVGR